MANKFQSAIKVMKTEIDKHRFSNRATSVIGIAAEKAQEKFNNVHNVVTTKYNIVAKQINRETTIFQDLNAAKLEPRTPLPKNLIKWWHWYQELTGLDKVELSKEQVIRAQDKLFKYQEERSQLNRQAGVINERLKEIYGELVQIRRDDPKYVQLTIMENKTLQDQAKIMTELQLLEKDERDHFTLLATAIKEYHDSQTMNAQKYKYLSVLASATIAIVSLVGSMLYNNKRISDVRHVVSEAQRKNESTMVNGFESLQTQLNANFSQLLQKMDSKDKPIEEHEDHINVNNQNKDWWLVRYSKMLFKPLIYVKDGVVYCGSYVLPKS